MSAAERDIEAALALGFARGLSTRARTALWREAGSAAALLAAGPDDVERWLAACGIDGSADAVCRWLAAVRTETAAAVAAARAWARGPGCRLLVLGELQYPELLAAIPDPPWVLFARGNLDALQRPCVAMVGSRRASHVALGVTRDLAGAAARAGACVVSGLAIGVDAAAHQGALAAAGATAAVLPAGTAPVYPRRHARLAQQIVDSGGLLLSELPDSSAVFPARFPVRNRLIAGLARAAVVTEARLPSGSLVTARLAMEFGRDVGAVPGLVTNDAAAGCHALIRDGAALVTDSADLLALLGIADPHESAPAIDGAPPGDDLLAALDGEPLAPEQFAMRTGRPLDAVVAGLLEHELGGRIERVGGGYRRLS